MHNDLLLLDTVALKTYSMFYVDAALPLLFYDFITFAVVYNYIC